VTGKTTVFVALWLLAATLSGCGTLGGTREETQAPVIERGGSGQPSAAEPAKSPKPGAEKPSSAKGVKGGGYYLDDGPGDNAPADIDAIPDAVVKKEPIRAASCRPYEALGVSYTPMTEYRPYKEQGIASWYGKRYHGQKTSSGELYDMYGMTAAHTVLPIPCYVRVTNPDNGRSVIVRVNDRGPFKKDRLIDLSYAAAYKLGIAQKGSGLVEVELIDPDHAGNFSSTSAQSSTTALPTTSMQSTPLPQSTTPVASAIFVQLGAFRQQDNANLLRDKIQNQGLAQGVKVDSVLNADLYRVRLGPYSSSEEAGRAAANIKNSLGIPAIVITQ
jgi:rare lipoprotein A